MKTIIKKFPKSVVNTVHQSGAVIDEHGQGLELHFHSREGETKPCMVELISDDNTGYAEIGLIWDENTLVDYDGVFEIPEEVESSLREMGFDVYL